MELISGNEDRQERALESVTYLIIDGERPPRDKLLFNNDLHDRNYYIIEFGGIFVFNKYMAQPLSKRCVLKGSRPSCVHFVYGCTIDARN